MVCPNNYRGHVLTHVDRGKNFGQWLYQFELVRHDQGIDSEPLEQQQQQQRSTSVEQYNHPAVGPEL
jgi:nucleotidyltransferase/DNA polymerase involved in DNA repair